MADTLKDSFTEKSWLHRSLDTFGRFFRWLDDQMRIPWTGYTMVVYVILNSIYGAILR